ncbi:MAG: 50S ribosomal protein L28 [Rhodothalassiaceae bacterium]
MSRVCELTGKRPVTGYNVSHSNRHTKRRFLPNLQRVSLWSQTLNRAVRMRITPAALRTVEHNDGLDNFLLTTNDSKLSAKALKLKKEISAKRDEAAAA